ncbi:MAG TPA: response regulator [Isosphaeraceae bacterium]|jgi:DNA-binding response OmpR family regulator
MTEPPPARLLIVEDHPDIRVALRRLLALRGWDVVEAATVAEGLAQLSPPPACVVLDLMLPDGDGALVLLTIRSEGLPSRVFVYTASYDLDRLGRISSLTPDAVFLKATDLARLLHACGSPPPN